MSCSFANNPQISEDDNYRKAISPSRVLSINNSVLRRYYILTKKKSLSGLIILNSKKLQSQ